MDDKVVVLRVQLDEGKTEDRMKELVLLMEQTRKSQQALTTERKAGTVSDEEFSRRTVELQQQLKNQRTEQTALQKNLELYRTAVNDTGGSYKGLQAQLSLAQNQFKLLDGSADNSGEAAKALGTTIDELRNTLRQTDETQSLFVRNLGNYPKGESLQPLIQQLVRLEEIQKSGTLTTQEAAKVEQATIGFKSKIAQAAAAEGKSYEETTNLVKGYSAAIRPAVANLVQLEQEQQKVAETGGEASEGVRKIGFQIAALEREIKAVPAESKKLSDGLKEVAGQNSIVASATEKYTGAKEKFTQASNLAKLAIGGEVTALGLLRLAIIATGLGALVVVLGSVVVFLTKTAEGTKLVENVMARVGAVVDVVTDRLGALGKAVVQALSGDFSGAADTARAAMRGIGDEIEREVKIAGDLSKARQQLNIDTANNIDTNKRLLNEVERLKNIRDNEFNTLKVRQKANEDAYAVELTRERTLAELARRRIAILKTEIDQRGGASKVSLEQLTKYKEAQNELSDILEDAAGKQNELITNRFQLNKEGLELTEAARKKLDDAMLKSIEAEIAAGQVREAQAAKFLDDQLKGDQLRIASNQRVIDEKRAAENAAYSRDLAMLDRGLNARRLAIEQDYAAGTVSKRTYEQGLEVIEQGSVAARILLAKHYGQDTVALEREAAQAKITAVQKVTEAEKAEQAKRVAQAEQLGGALTSLFAETVSTTGSALEDFVGKALILIIDSMEKTIIAAQVKILAEALATPQSAATFGVAGFAQAAATIAAVTVVAETLKTKLAPTPKQFAKGTVLGGASHAEGGVQLYSGVGYHFGEAEANEVVLTKGVWENPLLRPFASMLNVAGGGVPLLPRTHMAVGGVTSSQAAALRGQMQSGFDYNKLALAMSRVSVKATISDVKAGLDRDAYNDSLGNA